jgi:hypothetical protein
VPSAWDLGSEPLVGGVAVNRALRDAMAAVSISG